VLATWSLTERVADFTRLHAQANSNFAIFHKSINPFFARNTSSNETARTSRRDEQLDSQVPGALMAAFITQTRSMWQSPT